MKFFVRRRFGSTGSAVAAAVLGLALAGTAAQAAEGWPARTVSAVVPLGAGSSSDLMTRIVMDKVAKQVGATIVVENKPGAGGTIGAHYVLRGPTDGTVLLSYGALASAQALYKKLPYDTARDFTPVIPLGQQPLVVIASPKGGFKTLADLIAALKAKPGALNYASAGVGSASHFGASRLLMSAGATAQHIPYKGAADSVSEVMAGRVDFSVQPLAVALPLIKSGQLVALAVDATARAPSLPDTPTLIEAGMHPDAIYPFYAGVFVSSKTPKEIVEKIHAETAKALQDPTVQQRLATLGVQPMPMSMQEFKTFFEKDIASNMEIVKDADIHIQ